MRRTAFGLAILVVASMLLEGSPHAAYACSCVPLADQNVELTLQTSAVVVIGTVESISGALADNPVATIHVEQQFKGQGDDTVKVVSSASSSSCGYDLTIPGSRHFLPLRTLPDGQLTTSLCSAF